jgi:hypothetical protein
MDSRWRNMLNMASFYRTDRQLAFSSTRMSVCTGWGRLTFTFRSRHRKHDNLCLQNDLCFGVFPKAQLSMIPRLLESGMEVPCADQSKVVLPYEGRGHSVHEPTTYK